MNWLIRRIAKLCLQVSDEMKRQRINRPIDWSKIVGSIPDGWDEADSIGTLNTPDDLPPPETVEIPAVVDWSDGIHHDEDGVAAMNEAIEKYANMPDASIEGRAKVDDLTAKKWPADGPV